MKLLGLSWIEWLLFAYLIGYGLVFPLYTHRKKLKHKLVTAKFSISYLLFLTFIIALCVRVGLQWKRYSDAQQENQRLNSEVIYENAAGVPLDEQAALNQKRIADLEQQCEDLSTTIELETSALVRNKFALDRLEESWGRLESDIQIQKRPGFISLLPLPVKDTGTSFQYQHKRYKIQTAEDDRLEVVFKVLEGRKTLNNYQWSKSKNPDGPFTVVKLSKENASMRFSIPSGNSTLELKIHEQASEQLEKSESDLLELIVNDESLLLLSIDNAYLWFRKYNDAIAVQVDYPREKLHTRLKALTAASKNKRSLRLEMYLINTISISDTGEQVVETPAVLDNVEPTK